VSFDDIQRCFHMPIQEASRVLGVCATLLKKVCRQNGVARWPHRKVKCLDKWIGTIDEVCDASLRSKLSEQIVSLHEQRSTLQIDPNARVSISSRVKKQLAPERRRRAAASVAASTGATAPPGEGDVPVAVPTVGGSSHMLAPASRRWHLAHASTAGSASGSGGASASASAGVLRGAAMPSGAVSASSGDAASSASSVAGERFPMSFGAQQQQQQQRQHLHPQHLHQSQHGIPVGRHMVPYVSGDVLQHVGGHAPPLSAADGLPAAGIRAYDISALLGMTDGAVPRSASGGQQHAHDSHRAMALPLGVQPHSALPGLASVFLPQLIVSHEHGALLQAAAGEGVQRAAAPVSDAPATAGALRGSPLPESLVAAPRLFVNGASVTQVKRLALGGAPDASDGDTGAHTMYSSSAPGPGVSAGALPSALAGAEAYFAFAGVSPFPFASGQGSLAGGGSGQGASVSPLLAPVAVAPPWQAQAPLGAALPSVVLPLNVAGSSSSSGGGGGGGPAWQQRPMSGGAAGSLQVPSVPWAVRSGGSGRPGSRSPAPVVIPSPASLGPQVQLTPSSSVAPTAGMLAVPAGAMGRSVSPLLLHSPVSASGFSLPEPSTTEGKSTCVSPRSDGSGGAAAALAGAGGGASSGLAMARAASPLDVLLAAALRTGSGSGSGPDIGCQGDGSASRA
jgi:hypothetical protein